MSTERHINFSTTYFDWLEKALSEDYIKYYDYEKFTNKEVISSGSNGNVSRANWNESVMVIKYFYNSSIKEIVNEDNETFKSIIPKKINVESLNEVHSNFNSASLSMHSNNSKLFLSNLIQE
ncbi:4246_t:CDS:2 [Funneliformis caledonium]|uniref:4246_t:CDS:1 n=1 Tax=Funneliformis caledonium TaxID=1117310 RepID=A0A9N9HQG6_9GLOM|nr:4246_t:CDS:2 [Funneliformis caledonium]